MKLISSFLLALVGLIGFGQTNQSHSCQCPVCLGLPRQQQELRKEEEEEADKDEGEEQRG